MPDPALHGNGYTCPACELRREAHHVIGPAQHIPCNNCNDTGRIAKPTQQIVDETVAYAREYYWRLNENA